MPHIPILGNLSPLIPAGSDVDATLAFYTQKLGFTTRYTQGEPTEMAIVARDTVEIFLAATMTDILQNRPVFVFTSNTSSNSMPSITHRV